MVDRLKEQKGKREINSIKNETGNKGATDRGPVREQQPEKLKNLKRC